MIKMIIWTLTCRSDRKIDSAHHSEQESDMRTLAILTLVCFVFLSGCSSSLTKTTEKGLFQIKLSSKEELLKNGRNEITISVTDNKGAGVEHAKIEITPWMPEHGHGTMWPPEAIEQGKGLYRAVIPLTMTGHWELRIKIRKDDIQDSTVFDFPDVK
jgi:uncharacterized protein YceK